MAEPSRPGRVAMKPRAFRAIAASRRRWLPIERGGTGPEVKRGKQYFPGRVLEGETLNLKKKSAIRASIKTRIHGVEWGPAVSGERKKAKRVRQYHSLGG